LKLINKSAYYYFALVAFVSALVYFEFIYDVYPADEVSFFSMASPSEGNEKLTSLLYGLNAPDSVSNIQDWGYEKKISEIGGAAVNKFNRAAESSGKGREGNPFEAEINIKFIDGPYHHLCWQPSGEAYKNNCINRNDLSELLVSNEMILSRYEKLITDQENNFDTYLNLRASLIEISKQLSIKIWLKKESMSHDDLKLVSWFLYFWKSVIDNSYLDGVDFNVALVNYGIAIRLFHSTVLRYPQILNLYRKSFGEFEPLPIEQSLMDRIAIADFLMIDKTLCLRERFEANTTRSKCNESIDLAFLKQGRTIRLMYDIRPQISQCNYLEKLENIELIDSPWVKIKALARPGNYIGRLYALGIFVKPGSICSSINAYKFYNELFGLYQLYLNLKSLGYTEADIDEIKRSDPALFKIPNSTDYYEWNSSTKAIILRREGPYGEKIYSLPYSYE